MAKALRTEAVDKINTFLKTATEEKKAEVVVTAQEAPAEDVPADLPPLPEGELPPGMEEVPGEEGEGEGEEEEVAEKSVTDRLDTIEEAIKTMTEGLENQKEILEEILGGGTEKEDGEEDFSELLEDGDEEAEEESDEEEFGVDEEGLEATQDKRSATLRDKRKSRMAKKVVKIAEEKKDKSLAEQWQLDKSTKNSPKVYDTSPAKTTLPKGDDIPPFFKASDLTLVCDTERKEWSVLDGEKHVLHTIKQGSVADAEFLCEAFGTKFILDAQDMGLDKAIEKYNQPAVVEAPVAVTVEAPAPVVTEDEKKVIASNLQRRFVRAFKLATATMNKNLIYSPLKAALFDIMSNLNVDSPEKIIEAAFHQAANENLDVALQKTEEYLSMSDEAFVETESMIGGVDAAPVASLEVSTDDMDRREAMKTRASQNSLPFVSSDEEKSIDEKLYDAMPKSRLAQFFNSNKDSE